MTIKQQKATKNNALYLLSEAESQELYSLPKFSADERMDFFTLNIDEENILNELIYVNSKVHFILQLAYFKARRRLFNFAVEDVAEDLKYVMQRYFPQDPVSLVIPSRNAQAKNNKRILKLMNYNNSSKKAIALLQEKTKILVRSLSNPKIMLREILIYFTQQRIVLPGRTVVQNIIGQAKVLEAKRLEAIIMKLAAKKTLKLLDQLLEKKDLIYEITDLKKSPKNFQFNQIQKEIQKHDIYYSVYNFTKKLLPALKISQQNIEYYAQLANHYNRTRLNNFKKGKSYLYLLCYIYYKFQRIQDQLIETLFHYVDLYTNDAKEYAKKKSDEIYANIQKYLAASGKLLLRQTDLSLAKYKFGRIQQEGFKILQREKIIFVAKYMINQCVDKKDYEWEYYGKQYQVILKNLRPACMIINFQANESDQHLLAGINFIKSAVQQKKSLSKFKSAAFPIEFIPKKLRSYLYITQRNKKIIHPYRYEFLVYQQLRKYLDSGVIFCNDSIQYKSFESDIKIKYWEQRKHKILKEIDCPKLTAPITAQLQELKETLEPLIEQVNQEIINKENKHVKIKYENGQTTWSLKYEKKQDEFNNPFYDRLAKVTINSVIDLAEQQCSFMQAFTHINPYYAHQKANKSYIKGCLIANACSMGIYDLSNNSDLIYTTLATTQSNYFRVGTLQAASDLIWKKMQQLAIFNDLNFTPGILHAAKDGQKIKTKIETFKAKHSIKYFGTGKGIVSLTTILNNMAIDTEIIGAHEYEGHFCFSYDLLFSNSLEIMLHRLSTDSAGGLILNHLLHGLKGVEFAPHYKSIAKKTELIGTFNNPKKYEGYLIKPTHKFKDQLIIDEQPNYQPIIAALFTKETKQSIVIKKLCSYTRKSKTKDALWEYNNIYLSIYLLKYIRDLKLRQDVRGALNRIEAYNQLHSTLESIGGKKSIGFSDPAIDIWNECTRLLSNVIMYYNAYILSNFAARMEAKGKKKAAAFIKRFSTIATQHIILGGRHEFKDTDVIDLEQIMEQLERIIGDLEDDH